MIEDKMKNLQGQLNWLIYWRNILVRHLWQVYRDMSDIIAPDDLESIDLDLWRLVTKHDAVQSRLKEGKK